MTLKAFGQERGLAIIRRSEAPAPRYPTAMVKIRDTRKT